MFALRSSLRTAVRAPSRGLVTTARAAPRPAVIAALRRGITTSTPLADGGPDEIPHHGVNVENPIKIQEVTPAPGGDFEIVMVGAGNIMFGSDAGPWNHSFRLEHKLGPRLKVTALIDPNTDRANAILEKKRASFVEPAYRDTIVYRTIEDYHDALNKSGKEQPEAIIVGSPPMFRGGTTAGRNLELELVKLFPGVAYFIEKPVSAGPVNEAWQVTQDLIKNGNVVSVGYMLRYLRCVQKMKQIIHENDLSVMATNARYSAAYESIDKPAWWDKSKDMGPVIEQGTHFCDLSRYFGGDVDLSTVAARTVEWYEKPGVLSKIPAAVNEKAIPEEERIPRITSAVWKYENGAVGSFTHTVALQGTAYDCELEVWCDGYHMRLVDPYNNPTLLVRRPGDDHEEKHTFTDDDPFFSEISSFVDAIEGGPDAHILSSFEDATKTYELTWAIRNAGEKAAAAIKK
ncbi:putative protein [Vanrija pseudolonga]|uniref:Purtative protein n=1 Tax=Vanrija pseudolonga TaxID=143232 RepID=A0AAF0YG71_9TREE|nr:purtative protein [Vanrija pseudolonga]